MVSINLKPCKVCGGEGELWEVRLNEKLAVYYVKCKECKMSVHAYSLTPSKAEAIDTWNGVNKNEMD